MEKLRESDKENVTNYEMVCNTSEPLVSVLLLVYRNFDGIWKSLDSVFFQSYGNIELIINDDGSPNYYEYKDEIEAYVEKGRRENITSVVINHLDKNVGTTKNCNCAIRMSNGKYIKMLSPHDSFHDKDMIGDCVKYCEESGAQVLVGQTFVKRREIYGDVFDDIKNTPWYRFSARSGRKCVLTPTTIDIKKLNKMGKEEQSKLLSTWPMISTPSVFYNKDLFVQTDGYVEFSRLIEDMPYWPHLTQEGIYFHFAEIVMVDYSLNGMSNGGGYSEEFREDYSRIMRDIYIKNEYRGGIFNGWLKSVRGRNIKLTDGEKVFGIHKLSYLDVFIFRLFLNIKYFLLGTRL